MKIYWSVVNMDKEVLKSLKTLVKNQKNLLTEIKEVKNLNEYLNLNMKDLKVNQEKIKIELELINKKSNET